MTWADAKRGQLIEWVSPGWVHWRAIFHHAQGDHAVVHALGSHGRRGTHLLEPLQGQRVKRIRLGWAVERVG